MLAPDEKSMAKEPPISKGSSGFANPSSLLRLAGVFLSESSVSEEDPTLPSKGGLSIGRLLQTGGLYRSH